MDRVIIQYQESITLDQRNSKNIVLRHGLWRSFVQTPNVLLMYQWCWGKWLHIERHRWELMDKENIDTWGLGKWSHRQLGSSGPHMFLLFFTIIKLWCSIGLPLNNNIDNTRNHGLWVKTGAMKFTLFSSMEVLRPGKTGARQRPSSSEELKSKLGGYTKNWLTYSFIHESTFATINTERLVNGCVND